MRLVEQKLRSAWRFAYTFFKWELIAAVVGVAGGLIGTAFDKTIEAAGELRGAHGWILFLLPLGGVAIVALYKALRLPTNMGTNEVFESIRGKQRVPVALSAAIYLGTSITHLLGGSAGREGAALQLGGSVAAQLGEWLHLDEHDRQTITLCGMSAVFAAMFGTPLAAAFFPLEVIAVGSIYYFNLVPCLVSSFSAYILAHFLGVAPVRFAFFGAPELGVASLLRAGGMGIVCALMSIVFCVTLHMSRKILARYLKNEYIRVAVGGLAVIALTLMSGGRDYNGAGMGVIARALEGTARPEAFALKLLFTALTLGAGYKGGEIVPTFFVGATLGCAVGPLMGLDPSFGAALGLIGLFCGVTNTPIASILFAVEMFGTGNIALFAFVCAVSYMLSGYYGLYSSQKILYSKLKSQFVNVQAK